MSKCVICLNESTRYGFIDKIGIAKICDDCGIALGEMKTLEELKAEAQARFDARKDDA